MSYCTVKDCRYKERHNSNGHLCRQCKQYGHGVHECSNISLINKLPIIHISKDHECKIKGCCHPNNHTAEGHRCRRCKQYGHSWRYCDDTICELCNRPNHIKDECLFASPELIAGNMSEKIYICIYQGMGCFSYYKRDHPFDTFKVFNIGQYGYSKVPDLKLFLQAYKPLRVIDSIE